MPLPRNRAKFKTTTFTFDGTAGKGAVASPTCTIFNVVGQIIVVYLVPFCTVDLAGATATLALGAVGTTSVFVAATTATTIDANKRWLSTGGAGASVAIPASFKDIFVDEDIVATVATADITAGAIRFDMFWLPLSNNAEVLLP